MARVVFDANESDQQFQIEDGIRRTLETELLASVDQSVIEKCYELEGADGTTIAGEVEEKCKQICERGNLTYSLHEELAIFRRNLK